MQIGIVGPGKMGGNMALRLLRDGHDVVGFDVDFDAAKRLIGDGLVGGRCARPST